MTELDLTMTSGDDLVLEITVLDRVTELPVNLTGSTLRFAVTPRNSRRVLFSKSTGTGITTIDALAGMVEVDLIAADTDALSGTYEHELEITDVAGNRSTPLHGALTIRRDLIEP